MPSAPEDAPPAATAPAVFLASRNAKKLAEMERILGEQLPGIRVLGLDDVVAYDEPVEDQPDFAGNALVKARAGVEATGLPTLADDSGLCVEALNQMPGVLSARWSGGLGRDAGLGKDDANNALLLDQLADVPDERRRAAFRCAVALCVPVRQGSRGWRAASEHVVHGEMRGRVVREPRGSGGFGYDVVFVAADNAPGDDRTSAELTPAEKDRISHRGRALREIAPLVARELTA